jgi:hypothetical protein
MNYITFFFYAQKQGGRIKMNEENNFINLDTGEVIILEGDTSEYSIRKKADIQRQKDGFKKHFGRHQNPFFWGDMANITTLLDQNKITLTMLGAILVLGCHINYGDTLICKADRQHTPYARDEIKKILGMKETTFKTFVSHCKKVGILIVEGYGKTSTYRLNNEYHFVGKQGNKQKCNEMVRIYKEGIQSMFKSNLSLDCIGFLYMVLPHVDYKSCCIVDNPFAENPRPLTYKEIGDNLQFVRATIKKYLSTKFEHNFGKGKKKDMYRLSVFGEFKAGKTGYCVNPIILRRCATQTGFIEYSQLDEMFKITGTRI